MSDINPAASAAGKALRALRKTTKAIPASITGVATATATFAPRTSGTTRPGAIRTVDLQAHQGQDLAVDLVFIRFNNGGGRFGSNQRFSRLIIWIEPFSGY
jgi:hypothetical protein